ncbi:MAG: DUF3696 domain-containing protein [Halanaerobiales bacterium]|nr:DUF3696 domain-containing protein [Halanaerobiales bacterium]
MIKSLKVRNFKSLMEQSGTMEFKPLTILVGPNSSGKSSYLKSLLMMAQTLRYGKVNNLTLNGQLVKLGSYRDVVSLHEEERELELNFKLHSMDNFGRDKEADYKFCYKNFQNEGIGLNKLYTNGNWYKDATGFSLIAPKGKLNLTNNSFEDLQFLFSNLYYMGPLREYPQRLYLATGERKDDVGLRGEDAIEVLQMSKNRDELLNKVNYWLQRFGMAVECNLKPISAEHYFFELKMKESGLLVNITDVGFGVSQILPVIIEGYYIPDGSTFLIEQPEIHLHPRVQSELADLLIDISKNKIIVVETHSEHILTRIRRRVAEEKMSIDDVVIYYCEMTDGGTELKEIKLNEYGQFENWPSGFFEEELDDNYHQLMAIAKRKQKEEKEKK